MGSEGQGFLVVYEFEGDDRPLIIEDDGRGCHAHVRGPTGNIVSEAWLYNRVAAPAEAGSVDAAINHGTHAVDWGKLPFPTADADFRALMSRSTNRPTVFSILVRDELLAMLDVGERIGRCRLAKADGPLALRLPRPGEIYWQVVHPHWKQVDIYNGGDAFLRTFAAVPEPAGHLLALHWCQSEVCNGGFHQFFTNPTGVLAPEAARGFRAIGVPAIADIVDKAMAVFGVPYPRDRDLRCDFLARVPGETRAEWDPFTVFDDAFYEAIPGDLLYDAADQYAARTMPVQAQLDLMPEPQVEGRVCYRRLRRSIA